LGGEWHKQLGEHSGAAALEKSYFRRCPEKKSQFRQNRTGPPLRYKKNNAENENSWWIFLASER
jgi:hypothetical protein